LIRSRLVPLIAAAALMMSVMPGQAYAEGEVCPLITEADMTGAVGAPTTLLPFDGAVNEIGRVTSCIFAGESGFIIVTRAVDAFDAGAPNEISPEQIALVKRGDEEVNYRPIQGIGDTALWAQVADPELAKERMPFLLVKGGPDLYTIGSDDLDETNAEATSLAVARTLLEKLGT
jgi:hypothetical protein